MKQVPEKTTKYSQVELKKWPNRQDYSIILTFANII